MTKFWRDVLTVCYSVVGLIAAFVFIYWMYFCVLTFIPE